LSPDAGDDADDDERRQDHATDDEPECRSIHPDILGALCGLPLGCAKDFSRPELVPGRPSTLRQRRMC
jgi:hypothetical protein